MVNEKNFKYQEKRGVYIHIPFCRSICSYCDFCKMFYDTKWAHKYLRALEKEIDNYYMQDEIRSIYIGGGTPSILNLEEMEYLLKLTKKFHKMKNIEFTYECNLEDINIDMLKLLKFYTVTRLSIGIESFNKHLQDLMGRHHDFKEALEKIKLCRSLGFNNINIDLMYGFYNETMKDLKKDLQLFLKLKPEHISTYSLIINGHTLLKVNKIPALDDDSDAKMYDYICKYLRKKHFNHYEVSNFAKKGMESRHNLSYWDNLEYYGFGVSASGYIDKVRYSNTKNFFTYLKNIEKRDSTCLSRQDIMDYEIILGFRKTMGINKEEFFKKYQIPLEEAYPIKPLLKNKELKQKKEYIFISRDKLYVMNEILQKMV